MRAKSAKEIEKTKQENYSLKDRWVDAYVGIISGVYAIKSNIR